tara:strand:+ start:2009 stop:2206 length:198 start_codon:yes stop_codon:yes gene_type:complete
MKELRQEIANALKGATSKTAPNVYAKIQDGEGYQMVEELIIKMMVEEQFTAAGCIPHIDKMLPDE